MGMLVRIRLAIEGAGVLAPPEFPGCLLLSGIGLIRYMDFVPLLYHGKRNTNVTESGGKIFSRVMFVLRLL